MNISYVKQQLAKLAASKQEGQMKTQITAIDKRVIMEHAQQLMEHIVVFDKPWDMERCNTPYQLNPFDFEAQRNDDEEWCFMLNRMDYLSYLMLAGTIKNEARYYQKGKALILWWVEQHPQLYPALSTRTLDTGIRIMNIMEALIYLEAASQLTSEELDNIVTSLMAQINYLKEQYLPKYMLSNWGSIQTCAIVSVLPLLDACYRQHPLFIWAYEELERQLSIQVYEDGMHWEQSTMYHIEVLNYVMKAIYYQRFYGYESSNIITSCAYNLCDALFYQVTPQGQIEAFGDSDRVETADVFHRGAALFHHATWKYLGQDTFDAETLYSFGCELNEVYRQLIPVYPERSTFDGIDSGMYCIRSDWRPDANYTMFTQGSLGSGHGHSDNLHVSVYYKGQPFLIDTGRFTYREDDPLRVTLKSMASHNSVLIDGRTYCQPADSWGYQDFGVPLKTYVRHNGELHYLEATMIGHNPLQIWTRKIIHISCGIWFIADEVRQDGTHTMTQYFHVDSAIQVHEQDKGYQLRGMHPLQLQNQANKEVKTSPCSLRYNELSMHSCITFQQTFTDEANALTVLYPDHMPAVSVPVLQNHETAFHDDIAQAMKFQVSQTKSYTLVIFHKEVYKGKKICSCEGVPFHAKAVVILEEDGKKSLIRLKS